MHFNVKQPDVKSVILGFSYNHARNAPAYQFYTSANLYGFGDPDFLSCTYILAIGGHLTACLLHFQSECVVTAILELSVKILTSPLDFSTRILKR